MTGHEHRPHLSFPTALPVPMNPLSFRKGELRDKIKKHHESLVCTSCKKPRILVLNGKIGHQRSPFTRCKVCSKQCSGERLRSILLRAIDDSKNSPPSRPPAGKTPRTRLPLPSKFPTMCWPYTITTPSSWSRKKPHCAELSLAGQN